MVILDQTRQPLQFAGALKPIHLWCSMLSLNSWNYVLWLCICISIDEARSETVLFRDYTYRDVPSHLMITQATNALNLTIRIIPKPSAGNDLVKRI